MYKAASNLEGVTEVAYRRGALYNALDRSKEARGELERALKLAAETQNTYQRIRTLLQLSGVAATEGATDEAEKHASDAMTLARGMDSLTTSGLIDLGNVFHRRGELTIAEQYFQEGLAAAQRHRAKQTASRALLSLASVRISQGRVEQAMPLLDEALAFYRLGGYPKVASQAYLLLGQAHDLRGDFEAATKAYEAQLEAASRTSDGALVAQAHQFLALALQRWERLPQALDHIESAVSVYGPLDHPDFLYCMISQVGLLLDLGRAAEARAVFRTIGEAAPGRSIPATLKPWLTFTAGRLAVAERRWGEAVANFRRVLEEASSDEGLWTETAAELAVVRALQPGTVAYDPLSETALARARRIGDPALLTHVLLASSVELLDRGQAQEALEAARSALEEANRRGMLLSAWKASVLAARAARQTGGPAAAREHDLDAVERWTKLQELWGREAAHTLDQATALEPFKATGGRAEHRALPRDTAH